MNEKKQEQSWWSCYNAVGTIGRNGFPSGLINENKVYDNCCCIKKEILELNTYPTEHVVMTVGCGNLPGLKKVSVLDYITELNKVPSDEEKRGLRDDIERKTKVCKDCKHCEQKE